MELIACESIEDMVRHAHQWCQLKISPEGVGLKERVRSIFLPAGRTPTRLYEFWERHSPTYLRGLSLLQIDDVRTGPQQGVFQRYFADTLPHSMPAFRSITSANDLADLAILGFGLNGHVAFHEPGIPFDFFSGCVRLSSDTQRSLGLTEETWGVTYGLGAFLRTRAVLLMVSGVAKRDTFRRFLDEIDTFPATGLKRHADLTVLVDFDWK